MYQQIIGYVIVEDIDPDPRYVQPFSTPAGETGQIDVLVQTPDGQPFDCTGGQLLLTVRDRFGTELISRQGDFVDASLGTGNFPLGIADTYNPPDVVAGEYYYDAWLTMTVDDAQVRYRIVPSSDYPNFEIATQQGTPDQSVTPLPQQDPLAQGPQGDKGDPGGPGPPGPQGDPGSSFFWATGDSWSTFWATNPTGTVYVDGNADGSARTITAGSYDLNQVEFVGISEKIDNLSPLARVSVNVDAGVQIAGSFRSAIHLRNINMTVADTVYDLGGPLDVILDNSSLVPSAGNVTAFDNITFANVLLRFGSTFGNTGSQSVKFLGFADTSSVCEVFASFGSQIGNKTFGGPSGMTLVAAADGGSYATISASASYTGGVAPILSLLEPAGSATPSPPAWTGSPGSSYKYMREDAVIPYGDITPLGWYPITKYGAKGYLATTGTAVAGQFTVTLTSNPGFVVGDYIAITGAGAGGIILGARILGITSLTVTIDTVIATNVPVAKAVELDDTPAMLAAFDAATTYNGGTAVATRAGTVFFPPHPVGRPWNNATPFSRVMTQGVDPNCDAVHVTIQGSGEIGAIRSAVGHTLIGIEIIFQYEWYIAAFKDMCFISADPNHSTLPDCNAAVHLSSSTGPGWLIEGCQFINVWARQAPMVVGAAATIIDFADAGSSGGFDPGNGGILYLDEPQIVNILGYFSYGESRYNGLDYSSGAAFAAIWINPAQASNGWGPSTVSIKGMSTNIRTTWAVYCTPTTGTNPANAINVEDFHIVANTGGLLVDYCNHLELRRGSFTASVVRSFIDASHTNTVRIVDVDVPPGGTAGKIVYNSANSGTPVLEAVDVALSAISGSPCGIVLPDATTVSAFVVSAGIKSRVRRAQNTIVANTHIKPGATDGRVDQLGTGDDARLVTGVALDAASADDFIRVVEQPGQQVTMKSDGAGILAPTDTLTSSGASAGRVKKTTTVGASTVGLSVSTAAASSDALVQVIFQRGQY